MDLPTYLANKKLSLEKFGDKAGLSKASLSRIIRGVQKAPSDTLQRIIDASGGEVTPDSFFAKPKIDNDETRARKRSAA